MYLAPGAVLGAMPSLASLASLPTVNANPSTSASTLGGAVSLTLANGNPTPIAASGLVNLLPLAGSGSSPQTAGGVYVGEGLPPVPRRLADKICRWEFVDMAEMLPEFWPQLRDEDADRRGATPRRKPKQVTEFTTWLQCFAAYTSVLASTHPAAIPELMAYLVTVSRVSQDFSGLAWVRYDAAFRRQAALTGNRRWSQINPTLYSICFTGRAQQLSRCELCLSSAHGTKLCPLQSDPDPELPSRVKAVETALLSLASRRSSETRSPTLTRNPSTGEYCRLFNAGKCRYTRCRFRYVCSRCGESHSALSCAKGAPSTAPKNDSMPEPGVPTRVANHKDAARPY